MEFSAFDLYLILKLTDIRAFFYILFALFMIAIGLSGVGKSLDMPYGRN